VIKPERMSDEDAGVEIGRVDAGVAELLRKHATNLGDSPRLL
jgi:hypothetical protein